MQKTKSGIAKIISGIVLMLLGIVGIVKSQRAISRWWRLAGTTISAALISAGVYLFALGFDDVALLRIGKGAAGEAIPQSLSYESPKDFEVELQKLFDSQEKWYNKVRRLTFICADRSKGFRVFNTPLGILNIPKKNVVCEDGSNLIKYNSK